ncbi:MAG: hypothetical protein ACRDIY_02285 [Chloroflexota bacterium]
MSGTERVPADHHQKREPRVQDRQQQFPERLSSGAQLAASIPYLQRTIGNQAVGRLLRAHAASRAGAVAHGTGAPALQLVPASAVLVQRHSLSLAEDESIKTYAGEAKELWESMKDQGFDALAEALAEKVNALVPHRFELERKKLAFSALFDPNTWKMTVDTARFSRDSTKKQVGQLTISEVANVVDTFYHEARHSEQYFRIARMRIEDSKDPLIHQGAAEAAKGVAGLPEGKGKLTTDEREKAALWYEFVAHEGKYYPYGQAVHALGDIASEIIDLVRKVDVIIEIHAETAHNECMKAYHDFPHERDAEGLGKKAGDAFTARTLSTGTSDATATSASATPTTEESPPEKPKVSRSEIATKVKAQVQLIPPHLEKLQAFSEDPEDSVSKHVKPITDEFNKLKTHVEQPKAKEVTETAQDKLPGKQWYAQRTDAFSNILEYLNHLKAPLDLAQSEDRKLTNDEINEINNWYSAIDVSVENLLDAVESLADQQGNTLIGRLDNRLGDFRAALEEEEAMTTTSLKNPVVELEITCTDASAYFTAL